MVSVGIDSSVGRRKLDFMTENPAGVGIGASNRQSANRVELRVEQDRRGAVGLGPVHRLDIERCAGRELLRPVAGQADDRLRGHDGFKSHALGGAVGAGGVTVHVGHDALEHARAVEDRGAEPGGMRARADEAGIALVPRAVEPGPGLRMPGHAILPRPISVSAVAPTNASARAASMAGVPTDR